MRVIRRKRIDRRFKGAACELGNFRILILQFMLFSQCIFLIGNALFPRRISSFLE